MSWAKLDDGFWMHPKTVRAGNEAAGIFCRCLSYCGAYLTDGLIPEAVALSIAGKPRALEQAIEAGLLTRLDTGSIFIPNYSEYNPLRGEVEAKQAERQEKARKAAGARWHGSNGTMR